LGVVEDAMFSAMSSAKPGQFLSRPSRAKAIVVLGAIGAVVAVSAWHPEWIARPAGEQQVFVESELGKIVLPPGASSHAVTRGARSENALISRAFNIIMAQEDVVRSVDGQLSMLGWKFVTARPIRDWGRDFGGWSRQYCKGEYVAALQYAGQNAHYGWDYTLDISWQAHDAVAQPCNPPDLARKAAQGQ
jgi:hypothetical protein